MTTEFIAATVPAKTRHVSGTTLFQIAMEETGNALNWVAIAELNGLTDPWISGPADILIPPMFTATTPTGILGL